MLKFYITALSIFLFTHLNAQNNYGGIDTLFNPNDVGFSHYAGCDNSGTAINMGVNDFFVHPDGRFTICGGFHSYNGYYRSQLIRLNSDLSVDPSYEMNFAPAVGTMTLGLLKIGVQPSGKVVVGGDFVQTVGSSSAYRRIARLDNSGYVESSYSFSTGSSTSTCGTNDLVNDIAIQPDGKVIVAGKFSSYAGAPTNHIFRLGVNGGADNTFNVGSGITSNFNQSWITVIELLSDGKIMVAGTFTTWNNLSYQGLVRLNSDGSLDNTFAPMTGVAGKINAISELPGGKLVIGGSFLSYNGTLCNRICVLNNDGTIDTGFSSGAGFSGTIYGLSSDSSGNIFAGGDFDSYDGNPSANFACLSANGSWNSSWAGQFDNRVHVVKAQPDGSVLVGGQFNGYGTYGIRGFAKILPSGEIDTTFNRSTGVNYALNGTRLLSNNKDALIFGPFDAYNGTLVNSSIAKIDSLGNLYNTPFNNLLFDDVNTVYVDETNGKVLIGGAVQFGLSASFEALTQTDLNGIVDPAFNSAIPNSSSSYVYDIDPIQSGKYLISHQQVNDMFVNRINGDGSIDNSFAQIQGTNGYIQTLILSDQKFLVYGANKTYNSSVTTEMVRFNEDGTIDASFNMGNGPDNSILIVKEFPNGKLFVGGEFNTWNGTPQRGYVILNSDGSVAPGYSYPLNSITNQQIEDFEILPNGKWLVAGRFGNSASTKNVYLFYPDGSLDDNFAYKTYNNELNGVVMDLTRFDSAHFYLSGYYSSVNNTGANAIERISYTSSATGYDTIMACDSYTYQGVTYTVSKDSIYHSFVSSSGADSMVIVNLIMHYTQDTALYMDACDNFTWNINGIYYDSSVIVTDTILSSFGCDSIITLNLTIHQSTIDTQVVTACGHYTWTNNQDYSTSGIFNDTLISVYGCDSILVLNLTVLPVFQDTNQVIQCQDYTWPNNNTTYSQSGFYSDTLTAANGCDSIWVLDLTILPLSYSNDIQTSCDSLTWIDGITYYASTNTPTWTLQNAAGCDSVVTLDLTIIPSVPTIVESGFSLPSDANTCVGEFAIDLSGSPAFELNVDNGAQTATTSGYQVFSSLCPGIHDLQILNFCGDTTTTQFVIPIDSNYVFNNPFIDSLAQDSLGTTLEDCDIYYAGIDTAYIDSIWATGNTVNVIWNIVDSNGSNFDTTSYVLNNGNGVYYLQLSVLCPNKSIGDYFTVTEAIYFENGTVSSAGIEELNDWNVQLYPNPTNNLVTISYEGQNANLTIYDAQGKLIRNSGIHSGEQVSLREVETGVYFFELVTEKGSVVKRVVKQ